MGSPKSEAALQQIAENVSSLFNKLGVAAKPIRALQQDDSDWAFIIKLNSLLEASLNHLLVKHFKDDRLEDAISMMEMGDERKGKVAFLKALKILPPSSLAFIRKLGAIRNRLAHKITGLDFDLSAHILAMKPDDRNALVGMMQEEITGPHIQGLLDKVPRKAFLVVAFVVLYRIETRIANPDKSISIDEGLAEAFRSTPPKSNPKAR